MGKKPTQEFHAYGGDGGDAWAEANAQASNRVHIDTSSRNDYSQGLATTLIGGVLLVIGVAVAAVATVMSVTLIAVAVGAVGGMFLLHSFMRMIVEALPHFLAYKTRERDYEDREAERQHQLKLLVLQHHLNQPPQIEVLPPPQKEPLFLTHDDTVVWREVKYEEKAEIPRR